MHTVSLKMSMSAQDLLVQLLRHHLKSWLLSPFSSSSTGFLFLWILQGHPISPHSHSSLFLPLPVMVRTGAEWTGSFFMQSVMILFCSPTPVPPLTFCVMVPLDLQLRLHWVHCMSGSGASPSAETLSSVILWAVFEPCSTTSMFRRSLTIHSVLLGWPACFLTC